MSNRYEVEPIRYSSDRAGYRIWDTEYRCYVGTAANIYTDRSDAELVCNAFNKAANKGTRIERAQEAADALASELKGLEIEAIVYISGSTIMIEMDDLACAELAESLKEE